MRSEAVGANAVATALLAVLTLLVGAPACPAGVIDGHNPSSFDSRYDRFSTGYAAAPVVNSSPDFIGSPYDLSGIVEPECCC